MVEAINVLSFNVYFASQIQQRKMHFQKSFSRSGDVKRFAIINDHFLEFPAK